MCLDTGASSQQLTLYWSHGYGGNQFLALSKSGQLVDVEEHCVGINQKRDVILLPCSDTDKTQLWTYNVEVSAMEVFILFIKKKIKRNILWKFLQRKWMMHRDTGLCMQNNETAVILGTCNSTDSRCRWTFKSTIPTN